MSTPRATMRLQFHRGFTFANARSLMPYFAALGISHVYASPLMTARPGSMHGYDVIDPTRINPELGGEEELRRFVDELRRQELGLIVDIVPNHMAIGSGNAWWMDVLACGRTAALLNILTSIGARRMRICRARCCCRFSGDPMAKRSTPEKSR